MLKTCGECFFFNNGEPLKPGQHFAICPTDKGTRPFKALDAPACASATKTTLERLRWPLMRLQSIEAPYCVICGRNNHVEDHHIVRKGDGNIYGKDGKAAKKPTISLCGFGNTSGCHGLAHANKLHFRNNEGTAEYILLEEPTEYGQALNMDGWRPIRY